MSKPAPAIRTLMTDSPATIGIGASIADAARLMSSLKIRHLPVVDDAKRVQGLVSQRDLALVDALEALDASGLPVVVAMSKRPYSVSPDTPVDEVVTEMAERKLGSCIVIDQDEVVGVVTTVDVCRALAAVYRD